MVAQPAKEHSVQERKTTHRAPHRLSLRRLRVPGGAASAAGTGFEHALLMPARSAFKRSSLGPVKLPVE